MFRNPTRLLTVFCAALCALAVLSGCATTDHSASSSTSASTSAMSTPTASASASPSPWNAEAGANANRPLVDAALRPLFQANKLPSTKSVAQALTAAGIPSTALQVSADRTPKNLAADIIAVGVRAGQGCIIAQFNSDAYTSRTAAPVNDVCLVGKTADLQ